MITLKPRDDTLRPLPGLTVRMAERLQSIILAGEFKPGERLPAEHELARTFNVSRTVVREAVTRLKADGLIVSRRGAGAFVSDGPMPGAFRISSEPDVSLESVMQLAELRVGVESQSAALAAQRATAAQVRRMKLALDAMASAVERGGDGVAADVRFHRLVAEATGNPLILAFLEFLGQHLSAQIRVSRLNTAHFPGPARLVLEEHRAIYEAIAARDAKRARAMAANHLDCTIKRLHAVHRAADTRQNRGASMMEHGTQRKSSKHLTKRRRP
jgi:DNA-binding FadR family transcriptional regulator